MKFCKDCAHFELPFKGAPLHVGLCSRKTLPYDLVTGSVGNLSEGTYPYPFCKAERISLTGNCGQDAIHFQPKKDVPNDYSI